MKAADITVRPRKILIVKPSSLGDVVHSLPFLNAINTCFPGAKLHWVIAKGLEGLLEGNPMVDRLWVIDKDAWKKIGNFEGTIVGISSLFRGLKKEKFDIVVDLQGLLRSGIIAAATGSAERIGFQEAREGSRIFYTHKVKGGRNIHAVERYLKIAAFLGCNTTEVRFPFPVSFNSSLVTHYSSLSDDYAVIVPGARWKTKRWPPEYFGELALHLPVQSVIVGSKTDKDIANLIVSLSDGNAVSLAGETSLKQLIEVMKKAKFVVSNDSGPMHIAAALGVPVFAIFGPTDPRRTGPYGEGHTIIRADVPCAPCLKKQCDDMMCMNGLAAKKIYETIRISLSSFLRGR
jgi:heptosyltransferase I